jgi:hypothetical protein
MNLMVMATEVQGTGIKKDREMREVDSYQGMRKVEDRDADGTWMGPRKRTHQEKLLRC